MEEENKFLFWILNFGFSKDHGLEPFPVFSTMLRYFIRDVSLLNSRLRDTLAGPEHVNSYRGIHMCPFKSIGAILVKKPGLTKPSISVNLSNSKKRHSSSNV